MRLLSTPKYYSSSRPSRVISSLAEMTTEEDDVICRYCFESSEEKGEELMSPCACRVGFPTALPPHMRIFTSACEEVDALAGIEAACACAHPRCALRMRRSPCLMACVLAPDRGTRSMYTSRAFVAGSEWFSFRSPHTPPSTTRTLAITNATSANPNSRASRQRGWS